MFLHSGVEVKGYKGGQLPSLHHWAIIRISGLKKCDLIKLYLTVSTSYKYINEYPNNIFYFNTLYHGKKVFVDTFLTIINIMYNC